MIEIADFETIEEANAYAGILEKSGILCSVESSGWDGELDFAQPEYGPYILWVRKEDEEDALLVLASAEWLPEHENEGQKKMLVGGVVSGVGLLTSFGDLASIPDPWSWLPFGMILAGAVIFLKGAKEEKT